MTTPSHTETPTSQAPALWLLANLGYTILTPQAAMTERGGQREVLLKNILKAQLETINRIEHKNTEHRFSDANIDAAIQRIRRLPVGSLLHGNEKIYDYLTLGVSLPQVVGDDRRSFTLKYIDWKDWRNNVFHAVAEFAVERAHSETTARPDIALFVNGIPLGVIECKAPDVDIDEAVSQFIRNQGGDYIPRLFTYAQLLVAVSMNKAKYATVETPEKLWSVWQEYEGDNENIDQDLEQLINQPVSTAAKNAIAQSLQSRATQPDARAVTEQDRALYCLCRPERLLDLAYYFTLFEHGAKKIARYQQYFVVKSTLDRLQQVNDEGKREGGIVWHTQGSGKSLTMVMLIRSLLVGGYLESPRFVLVTDRVDLDKQLDNTFRACGLPNEHAKTSSAIPRFLKDKVPVFTTTLHKFTPAWNKTEYIDDSPNIIVLVDECHRSNYNELAAPMRCMLPKASFIGFTGTPLVKKEKNTFLKFGKLIQPHYSVKQAVADKAVVPLFHEGRLTEITQDGRAMDLWFERLTTKLSEEQKADMKRKYARARLLDEAEPVIRMRAHDIGKHYAENWQDTGLKAQLVAPSKNAAILYHEYLQEYGEASSEVVISAPDTREGYEAVGAESHDRVVKFWQQKVRPPDTEATYTDNIINRFKDEGDPEILIVVDKLLTGFDAPRNAVLYLCRKLKGHTLLQAIARVNRLREDKDHGLIVDYVGVLGELGDALATYDALEEFDEEDLEDAITAVSEEVGKLEQHHENLRAVFDDVSDISDREAVEKFLGDETERGKFYERLRDYAKALATALATERFWKDTDDKDIKRYKAELKYFMKLRKSVQYRYAEKINFGAYEKRIRKLLDAHLGADDIVQLNEPINIFTIPSSGDDSPPEPKDNAVKADDNDGEDGTPAPRQAKDKASPPYGSGSGKKSAAQADAIAHSIKRVCTERMDEDPALYAKFSEMVQAAINAYRLGQALPDDYLSRVQVIHSDFIDKINNRSDAPERIRTNAEACAFFRAIKKVIGDLPGVSDDAMCDAALAIEDALRRERKVDFWRDEEANRNVRTHIDDFYFDVLRDKYGVTLSNTQMDEMTDKVLRIAKNRKMNHG